MKRLRARQEVRRAQSGAQEPPDGSHTLGALHAERGSGQQREPHAVVRGGVRDGGEERRGDRRRAGGDGARGALTRRVRRSRRRWNARRAASARGARLAVDPVSSRVTLGWMPPGATRARANAVTPRRASRARAVAIRLRRTYVAGDRDRTPIPAAGRGLRIAAAENPEALAACDRQTGAMPAPTTLEIAIAGGTSAYVSELFLFLLTNTRRPRAAPDYCAAAALAESSLDPARRRWCSRRSRNARRLSEWSDPRARAPRHRSRARPGQADSVILTTWIFPRDSRDFHFQISFALRFAVDATRPRVSSAFSSPRRLPSPEWRHERRRP